MKNYLIVGASSGIGKALSKILIAQGHQVFGTNLQTSMSDIRLADQRSLDVTADHLDLDFVPDQLHGMAYCPGSINLKPFSRLKPQAFVEDYQLQVVGAIKVLQSILSNLKKGGSSSVVLFSTVAVQLGFPFHSQVAASKGAIEGLGRSLAAEFAPKIRVNVIAPSLTDTPLAAKLLSNDEKKIANAKRHPLQRLGTAEDSAEMAAFLLSDKASWISGQVIGVDGGVSRLKV